MINPNGHAELKASMTTWGERIKVCTECGERPVLELRTVIDSREYHNCTRQPIRYWSDRLGQYVTVPCA